MAQFENSTENDSKKLGIVEWAVRCLGALEKLLDEDVMPDGWPVYCGRDCGET
jgi:hypothetical protein